MKLIKNKLLPLILDELKKGTSATKIAEAIFLGIMLGIFPLLGFSTALAFLAAVRLKLNQVIIQTVNYFMYPVQLLFIPLYLKLVTTFFPSTDPLKGAEFKVLEFIDVFRKEPLETFKQFSAVGGIAVLFWLTMCLILFKPVVNFISSMIQKRMKTV